MHRRNQKSKKNQLGNNPRVVGRLLALPRESLELVSMRDLLRDLLDYLTQLEYESSRLELVNNLQSSPVGEFSSS